MIIIILFTVSFLFALMHACFVADRLNHNGQRERWVKYWHRLSYLIRAIGVVAYFYYSLNLLQTIILVFATWHCYDIVINLINGWKWYYIGQSSETEKKYKKYIWPGKVALIVVMIVLLIL